MQNKPLATTERSTVLITGTSRGIGRALAVAFAEAGAHLVLHARDAGDVASAAEAARRAGATRVRTVAGDLRERDLGRRLVAAAEGLGGIDLAILSAAILGPMAPFEAIEPEAFRDVLNVDVACQLQLAQALLPAMAARGRGVLLWLSSSLGRVGLPRYGAYCAAKHAVEGLMKVAAAEYRHRGILTLTVSPGMVQTDMLRAALGREDVKEFQTPEDTARAFVRMTRALGPEHHGVSLDIDPWLVP